MTYHLLTGATGLLGSYLLRDCLRRRHRLAVFVRPSKRESARERIEAILSRCEAELRTTLGRPVVIEGELTEPDLGLDGAGLRWIARHCRSVIHNAASLTFHGSDRQGEPWHTNLDGTRRILDLCRTTGIRQFHYVSTAYVCGLREGRVLETELDVGQTPGNDYEHSKIESEKLVRAAGWIDPPTIYRPAIIVGDSQTGYTATYHGFYALVKLAHTLVSRMVRGSTAGRLLVQGFGLSGEECKNLVPVNWVSAVCTHIFSRPQHHGRTYHVVTRRPPSLALIADVIQQAVEEYSDLADETDSLLGDGGWFIESFKKQVEVYQAYWRDDPQFDDRHRAAAAPLACPAMDAAMLLRLARFAIQGNFGRTRTRIDRPEFDIHTHVHTLPARHGPLVPNLTGNYCLGLDVRGPGGGQWKLVLHDGRPTEAEDGLGPQCSAVFQLDAPTFLALGARKLAAAEAVRTGRLVIEGNGLAPTQLTAILQATAAQSVQRPGEAA
jgi:nucleoside-diphosphate-sugar epimerase